MDAPVTDYRELIKLAKKGALGRARRQVDKAVRATPNLRTSRYACLLYATGLVRFREGKYEDAYVCHTRARHMWGGTSDELAPNVEVENDLALFYALVAAGRRRFAWPMLKGILSADKAPFGDQLAAMAAFAGGKRVSQLCWRLL